MMMTTMMMISARMRQTPRTLRPIPRPIAKLLSFGVVSPSVVGSSVVKSGIVGVVGGVSIVGSVVPASEEVRSMHL